MSNLQAAFDKAVAGILAQGRPAYIDNTLGCQYRLGSLKCAIGQLIPDDEYDPAFEKITAQNLVIRGVVPGLTNAMQDIYFAEDLQTAHDQAAMKPVPDFLTSFRERAAQVAEDFELDPSILNKDDLPPPPTQP